MLIYSPIAQKHHFFDTTRDLRETSGGPQEISGRLSAEQAKHPHARFFHCAARAPRAYRRALGQVSPLDSRYRHRAPCLAFIVRSVGLYGWNGLYAALCGNHNETAPGSYRCGSGSSRASGECPPLLPTPSLAVPNFRTCRRSVVLPLRMRRSVHAWRRPLGRLCRPTARKRMQLPSSSALGPRRRRPGRNSARYRSRPRRPPAQEASRQP